jgi:3-dehydroquinate synthase
VHAIAGKTEFNQLKADFPRLTTDRRVLLRYIQASLLIKQRYIEIDEFDRSIRNIFNYGHSFGHAIESATHFEIPHGVAVTMGMDMANHIAAMRGLLPNEHRDRMHGVLRENYSEFADVPFQLDDLLSALMKDKKNTATQLMLIFPVGDKAEIQRIGVSPDDSFRDQCEQAMRALQG